MYERSTQGWLKHIDFILLDVIVLLLAYICVYMFRFGNIYLQHNYKALVEIFVGADVLVAVLFNTMHNVMKRKCCEEFIASIKHVILVLMLMSLYLFSTRASDTYSRFIIYLTSGVHLILGYFTRLCWKLLIRKIKRGKAKHTMVLVANENVVNEVLQRTNDLGKYKYVGIVITNRDATGEIIQGVNVTSNLENAADYICRNWVDEVFIYPEHMVEIDVVKDDSVSIGNPVADLIKQCREMAIPVHIRLPIFDVGDKNFFEKIGEYNVLTMTSNYAKPGQLLIKRLLDILGGIVGSVVALVLIAVLGPKIKKESPGPVLFKQTRIGKNGKIFKMYKIRTMYLDAEEKKSELMAQNRVEDGMMFKLDFDPRIIGNRIVSGKQVTGIGEAIRSNSLDEFPQFFNVLKGEMSLVGTRPPTEDEWEKYKYHHRARLSTKPGITGMWQVSGRSKITDFEEVVKLDTEYINNWNIVLDIYILLKTIKVVLAKNGAM